jgi:hypothetical protein
MTGVTLWGVAALTVALVFAACANGLTPTQGPSLNPSSAASSSADWPSFEPGNVHQAVAQALGMSCESIAARIHCQTGRPSGARFEVVGPDGTNASDRELTFIASGPIELESESRRLFATVADAISGDSTQSREWLDQVWAAFADPSMPATALQNGVSWSASRQDAGGVLNWSLSLTW